MLACLVVLVDDANDLVVQVDEQYDRNDCSKGRVEIVVELFCVLSNRVRIFLGFRVRFQIRKTQIL